MISFFGEIVTGGGKLKELGTSHWNTPNTRATNETGFTGLPGGWRNISGTFVNIGNYGYWWSASESSVPDSYYSIALSYNNSNIDRGWK